MAVYSKQLLSGSTNGRNIKVAATSTPGTLVHTAAAGTSSMDEVFLYAVNHHTATVTLTVEFGGVSSPDDLVKVNLEAGKGAYMVVPGWLLNNGLAVRAFASEANAVTVNGYVNRIS